MTIRADGSLLRPRQIFMAWFGTSLVLVVALIFLPYEHSAKALVQYPVLAIGLIGGIAHAMARGKSLKNRQEASAGDL